MFAQREAWQLRRRDASAYAASAVFHGLAMAATVWLAARTSLIPAPRAEAKEPVVVIVDSSPRNEPCPDDLDIQPDDAASIVALPGFTFDFGKVASRATSLFPFLTGGASLEAIASTATPARSGRLTNPFGRGRPGTRTSPPLFLDPGELQSLVDKSWSRRDRWRAFQPIVPLADAYNAEVGGLPQLLKAYGVQNGLQPYVDSGTRDPRLWTQLGLAAEHLDFIDFIAAYVRRHPSTKSATELLLLLDQMVQGSADTLTTLLETDPETQLQWTRQANRAAYDAVIRIRAYYLIQLQQRGLTPGEAVRRYFDAARLSVLGTLLATTPNGYRSGDARFLMGAIYWRQQRGDAAVRAWRDIVVDPNDVYVESYSRILAALQPRDRGTVDSGPIFRALEGERSRWLSLSYDRLHQFGYRFNTF